MENDRDALVAREVGRTMRFFLNLSCVLLISCSVFFLWAPRLVTHKSIIIALIPVTVVVLFFLVFLRLLRRLEDDASKQRDIQLASRVIWEFNKSWLIRAAVGEIKAFIEEKEG